jgi:hypothetical protein
MDEVQISAQSAPRWGYLLFGSALASYVLSAILFSASLAATFAAGVAAVVSDSPDHHWRAAWGVACFGGAVGAGLHVALAR